MEKNKNMCTQLHKSESKKKTQNNSPYSNVTDTDDLKIYIMAHDTRIQIVDDKKNKQTFITCGKYALTEKGNQTIKQLTERAKKIDTEIIVGIFGMCQDWIKNQKEQ